MRFVSFRPGVLRVAVIAVIGQLYQVERRTKILEPDALLVIFMVLGSLGLIYVLR